MLSQELRARLSQLPVAPAPSSSATPSIAPLSIAPAPRGLPVATPARQLRFDGPHFGPPPILDEAIVRANDSGEHLCFRRPLTALWPAATLCMSRVARLDSPVSVPQHAELAAVLEHFPARILFLDLETCGFAGSPVFLAGVIWSCDGELLIDQLFARNYAEERSLLEGLWQIARQNQVLATFNGKSFDWPMVRDRTARHRLRPPADSGDEPALVHCDLLHHARRRWKHVLPNCKLQTLEQYVCRRTRRDDLGGALVPAAYHAFVRSRRSLPDPFDPAAQRPGPGHAGAGDAQTVGCGVRE